MNRDKITIYQYWYGDELKREKYIEKIAKFNKKSKKFYIHLGPDIKEQEHLMKTYDKYVYFIENKQYELASDFYKFYIMATHVNAIYLDISTEFDETKLYRLYTKCENEKRNCFVFDSYKMIWPGFFINTNLSNMFIKCLEDINSKRYVCGSLTLTKELRNLKLIEDYRTVNKDVIKQLDISFLCYNQPIDTIRIYPDDCSVKKDINKIWRKKVKNFYKTYFKDTFFLNSPNLIQKILWKYNKY